MQERRNSSALAMELRLSCINPFIWKLLFLFIYDKYFPLVCNFFHWWYGIERFDCDFSVFRLFNVLAVAVMCCRFRWLAMRLWNYTCQPTLYYMYISCWCERGHLFNLLESMKVEYFQQIWNCVSIASHFKVKRFIWKLKPVSYPLVWFHVCAVDSCYLNP